MQINFKQTEITAALRQYVAAQGINLSGKSVDVVYTAGRKEGGLTAEINIEEQDIPGYTTGSDPVQLSLVATTESSQPEPEVLPVVEQDLPAAEETAAVAPAPSLFG